MLWLPVSMAEGLTPVMAQCAHVAGQIQFSPHHPSGPAFTQLSMYSQLKTTPAHSLTAHSVWVVDNMHIAFMHVYFLACLKPD